MTQEHPNTVSQQHRGTSHSHKQPQSYTRYTHHYKSTFPVRKPHGHKHTVTAVLSKPESLKQLILTQMLKHKTAAAYAHSPTLSPPLVRLAAQHKPEDTATHAIPETFPLSISAHLDRRYSSGSRAGRLGSKRILCWRASTGAGPSSSTDTALSPREAPKSREKTEMKLRQEPGGSGKCSLTAGNLWLAHQDARRHNPPTLHGVHRPGC